MLLPLYLQEYSGKFPASLVNNFCFFDLTLGENLQSHEKLFSPKSAISVLSTVPLVLAVNFFRLTPNSHLPEEKYH
ncbi:hypothetical protein ACE1CI_36970 [Aerosakkonemataceae cyanobacterium BLCC-F50]|uniref:Uncharacterized protein n=1 Tax=Floridaenema flaviceps BLCC-F50 TaxID=3153642 RepID=A0ABV4Y4C8_9CYAN